MRSSRKPGVLASRQPPRLSGILVRQCVNGFAAQLEHSSNFFSPIGSEDHDKSDGNLFRQLDRNSFVRISAVNSKIVPRPVRVPSRCEQSCLHFRLTKLKIQIEDRVLICLMR